MRVEDNGAAGLARRINDEHRACERALRSAVEHAVRAGQLLIEAKAQVGHGGWLPWLEENFAASEDTAQTYMRLARHKVEVIDAITERARYSSVREAMAAIAPPEPEPPGSSGRAGIRAAGNPGGDEGDPGPMPQDPTTREGEVILLGRHRLMCADATVAENVRRLAAGEKAAAVWSDPPWGVDYEGKTRAALKIRGDLPNKAPALLADALVLAEAEVLLPGAAYYIVRPSGELAADFGLALRAAGWKIRQELVWRKDVFVRGRGDHHYDHETCFYGYSPAPPGFGRRGRLGGTGWYGGHNEGTVFEFRRPRASREHPTMKPVELISAHLLNSTQPGQYVYDPFAGSGSTLIACEILGRRALAMEIDPKYCDVVCARWQRETGVVPVVEGSGERRDYLLGEVA